MQQPAKVEQAVFDYLRPRLKQHREDATELSRTVSGAIAKTRQHAADVVAERRRQLARAQAQLESCECQEDADCSGFRRRVALAAAALESAVRGRELIEQAATRFAHQQAKYRTSVEDLLLRAEKLVRTADERTIDYQKASQYSPGVKLMSASPLGSAGAGRDLLGSAGPLGGAPAPLGGAEGAGQGGSAAPDADSWQDWPGVQVPAQFPAGFALIPIASIIDADPVTGSADFDNDKQDLAVLRWSVEALLDVVLGTLDGPGARQYLRERDAREGLTGPRSYSGCYDGFFSPGTALKMRPSADGNFELINGRHRLWLLRRAGAAHVPALIRGPHP